MSEIEDDSEVTLQVHYDDGDLTVRKIFTRKGERLEIAAVNGSTNRIDPLQLQSLSWQDEEVLAELTETSHEAVESGVEFDAQSELRKGASGADAEEIKLANEYALVRVRQVDDQLEIRSPRLGYAIRLDGRALVGLLDVDSSTYSTFLTEPFGPEDELAGENEDRS